VIVNSIPVISLIRNLGLVRSKNVAGSRPPKIWARSHRAACAVVNTIPDLEESSSCPVTPMR